VRLLGEDPGQLVLQYRSMLEIVVWNAIRQGMFSPREKEDLVQSVTVRLLELMPVIRRRYDGSSQLRTYVSVIVVNLLKRMARGQKQSRQSQLPAEPGVKDPALELPDHDIQVYVRRLERILQLFGEHRPKLLVILKCYYHIVLDLPEILAWYPACDPFSRDQLLELSRAETGEVAYGAVFAALAPIVGEVEHRWVSADTLRKWTDHRIREIVHLLNGNPPQAAFDRKTLGELLERLSISPGDWTI